MLPIAAGLAILLLMIVVVAGVGLSGTSWFDRSHNGFAHAQSLFGGQGLSADTLGTITLLLIPVQVLLVVVALLAFSQGWNVEQEVPIDEARKRGYNPPEPRSGEPATA
jgi:nitric oxide reductase large subunit